MSEKRLISVDSIEALLFAQRTALFERLRITGGNPHRREGQYLVALNPTRADKTLGSFKINLHNGKWADFSSGEGAKKNPMLGLVCMCATGGDFVRALDWSRDFLGLSGNVPPANLLAAAHEAKKKADEEEERARETKRARARRIWHDALELSGNDGASLYLAGRGIDVMALAEGPPRSLRFHPAVYASDGSGPYPALIAHVSLEKIKSGLAGVHRIYLKSVDGRYVKAREGDQAKESLGSIRGGSIRLTKGASSKRLADAPAGEWIATTEGIEDGLSIAVAMPHLRIVTPASVSNWANMVLPPQIGGVWICCQNDAPGSKAEAAMMRAAYAFRSRGLGVKIVRMPQGFKDPNEVLQLELQKAS